MITINTKQRDYVVKISKNNVSEVVNEIISNFNTKNYIILTEKGIPEKFVSEIYNEINKTGVKCHLICLEKDGEKLKSFDVLEKVLENVMQNVKITRNSVFIALGGGVIGDLGGFTASVLMRGIKLVQVPTTLLAMVDSGIGGKTGINFCGYKNVLGTFYQPHLVLCNVNFLTTLEYSEYISGYVELFKHAIISDRFENLFNDLIENKSKIIQQNLDFLAGVIDISCRIKGDIVMQDENETLGIRSFLNLGHTIGHAIEKISELDGKILHGFAVAIGIIAEMKLAKELGILENAEMINQIEEHFKDLKIPTRLSDVINNAEKYHTIMMGKMLLDKKNNDARNEDVKISFALPKNIGKMQNVSIQYSELETLMKKII